MDAEKTFAVAGANGPRMPQNARFIPDDDPMIERIGGLDGLDDTLVLCATARLARHLREAHGRRQMALGRTCWQPLRTATVVQWLNRIVGEAMLAGEIPVAASRCLGLSSAQERLLWERAIETLGAGTPEEALFDREGLAQAAAEAHELVESWGIGLDTGTEGEETLLFKQWRQAFLRMVDAAEWREPVRQLEWQIGCLARGAGRLPDRVALAGFDRLQPRELRLLRVLVARSVTVVEVDLGGGAPAAAVSIGLADARSECRAAAAWAARCLAENPAARLGIVVPELGALRAALVDSLDEALHPAAFNPAAAEAPRCYDFSLGEPLAHQALVATALALLALAADPARIEQSRLGELLHRPYWSVEGEADERDLLDAALREKLAPQVALVRVLAFARRLADRGLTLPRTLACLEALASRGPVSRQLPSLWARDFATLIAAAGWPGDRPLSSHEWQARQAFIETLDALGQFDVVLGRVGFHEALRRVQCLARERIFQPEAEGTPAILVMGLLEAVAEPLDGLWVMGMNEHAWPPPARPNPLLPAQAQRWARAPNAGAEVQVEFAATIHRRLLHSATHVVFSWAQSDTGRELRPSPLLAGLPVADKKDFPVATGLVEQIAAGDDLVALDDSRAPPLAAGEHVRGGTALLKAQAVCPAWAFYQYRLGARALGKPVAGLDPARRGTLLHGVLEHFWRGRSSQDLAAMDAATRTAAIVTAAAAALVAFNQGLDEPLAPRFAALEQERLIRLAEAWLAFEAGRPAPFRVIACEQAVDVEIEGIAVHFVVDRIDELADGRRLVIDYKTTATLSARSWNDERMIEPQLPVYASVVAQAGVAGVAFAQVRIDKQAFIGIAAEGGLLPAVAGIGEEDARKLFPVLAGWNSLLEDWRRRIAAIAREVREGVAVVRVSDESALAYCDVLPLLRLAEVDAQREGTGA